MIWGLERSSTFQPIPIFSGSFSGAKVRTSCERNSIFITSKYCLLSSFFLRGLLWFYCKSADVSLQVVTGMSYYLCKNSGIHHALCPNPGEFCLKSAVKAAFEKKGGKKSSDDFEKEGAAHSQCPRPLKNSTRENAKPERPQTLRHYSTKKYFSFQLIYAAMPMVPSSGSSPS